MTFSSKYTYSQSNVLPCCYSRDLWRPSSQRQVSRRKNDTEPKKARDTLNLDIPPLNHVAKGAVVGLLRASKNQNHLQTVRQVDRPVSEGYIHIHIGAHREITGILVDSRCRFTYA